MTKLFENMKAIVKKAKPLIVFPEGGDSRIQEAAVKLAEEDLLTPILIGKIEAMPDPIKRLTEQGRMQVRYHLNEEKREELAEALVARRKGKITLDQAIELLSDENYYGTMLVYSGAADGLVSGACHSTANTVRPALQIIKTKPGVNKTSGAFIMVKGEEQLVFADCAINISPTSEELAEIAIESARTARAFGIDPKVAMLSFSTRGSAKAPEAEKVTEAVRIINAGPVDFPVDGELQFDAAYVPDVANKKAPNSQLEGRANVFVFPSLEAGNIGYKMVQRLGGFEAVGPILQGLNQPVNDLSRGCSTEDVYNLALITARQSMQ